MPSLLAFTLLDLQATTTAHRRVSSFVLLQF
jgi:hypothetical protein